LLRLFFIFVLLFSFAYSKNCFRDKSIKKFVCYKKYFDKKNIHKAKFGETYYTADNGNIYSFSDKIEVQFYAVGAILSILDDFEVDFYDKTKGETYIFKVRNPNELFSITTNLNRLTAIKKALPLRTRKYTKSEVRRRVALAKARQEKALQKAKAIKEAKAAGGGKGNIGKGIQGNFLDPSKNEEEPKGLLNQGNNKKSFLNPTGK